ncbi:nuclear factor 7, brain-like [Chanos chanos]|uniref:Nuclear factor 7, brain-like n=1 Tax=Chanos chanos TaxID=29144 RepID=A0A6J2WPP3_CHACN|nr:nuclear factor 7, brain-like [Chanos chanos]
MALNSSSFEEYLCCPVCRDIFQDPVLLWCCHSFCSMCLRLYWEHTESQICPLCRRTFSMDHIPTNLALKNLCEVFLQERSQRASAGSEEFCQLHSEKLKLFCLDDKQPVCVVCRDSEKHTNHNLRPISEAALQLKCEVRTELRVLQKRLRVFQEVASSQNQTLQHIQAQAQNTERQIKEEFEKLHQFLRDEEESRIAALREEEEEKSQMMKEKIEEMRKCILSLTDTISTMEYWMQLDNAAFLQKYKTTADRSQCPLRDPEMVSGSLINVAKHLGNLKFRVWEKMQEIVQYTPVILDPNTAHPDLYLCESLSSVKFGEEGQQLPGNPERFDDYSSVLGSEGFESGSHCWDIEVGDNTAWAVGVITESVYKHRENQSQCGFWQVGFYNGKYGKSHSEEVFTPLRVEQKVQRIRVQLDWEKGKMIFTDSGHNTCLHIFKHNFTERVFPYFYNHCKLHPLKILPVKPSISVELHS